MTQIIGIVCKEAILVASEAQYTTGASKSMNAKKISILKFENGDAIVAEAGNQGKSSRAMRYMVELAKGKKIDNELTVSRLAEEAIRKVRRDLLSSMQDRTYSAGEQEAFFGSENNRFGLMIAHYYKPPRVDVNLPRPTPVPSLFTVTLKNGLAQSEYPVAVLGSADRLAAFILKDYKCEELLWGEAACLTVDTLERIMAEDIHCGGKVVFATVHPTILAQPTAAIYDDDLYNRISKKLYPVRENNNRRYKEELGTVMKQIHQENYETIMKQMKEEEERENQWKGNAPGFQNYGNNP